MTLINPNTGEPFGKQRITADIPMRVHFFTEGEGLVCSLTAATSQGEVTINAPGSSMSEAAGRAVFALFAPKPPRREAES